MHTFSPTHVIQSTFLAVQGRAMQLEMIPGWQAGRGTWWMTPIDTGAAWARGGAECIFTHFRLSFTLQ